MVNLVRVKRKRGLPSPADRLYVNVNVNVNDEPAAAEILIRGLSLGEGEGEGEGGGSGRPRTKRYRRIVGNMTLLELEAQEFRDGFEALTGGENPAGGRVDPADRSDASEARPPANTVARTSKRKPCGMTYAVVKRRREGTSPAQNGSASGSRAHGNSPPVNISNSAPLYDDLDPLRRLGASYRVCDLEFSPATPDVKTRAEDDDGEDIYDIYVEDDGDRVGDGDGDGDDGDGAEGVCAGSRAIVYVDDSDFFYPEFDLDHESGSDFDSEDSNREGYFMNDYPDEDDHGGSLGRIGGGWESGVDEYGGWGGDDSNSSSMSDSE